MAIPGSKPKLDVHAKVRIGVKRESNGREFPAAVDYFVCDSPAFAELVETPKGKQGPSTLRIRLVHDTIEDAFSTGLEWWVKSRDAKKPTLACYTKDGGSDPIALRKSQMLDPDDVKRGDIRGEDRQPITCRARECPHMQKKGNKPADCKPMGRLVFVLDGDPLSRVFQLDTKAWNSIEALSGALRLAQARASLTGRLFELSVAFQNKGRDRFPVLSIAEIAETDPQTARVVANGESAIAAEQTEGDTRAKLIAAIRAREKDPRDPEVVAWVQKHGVEKALRLLTASVTE